MKIAFITFQYSPEITHGGISTFVKQVAELLVTRGHHVEVFTSSELDTQSYTMNGVLINRVYELNKFDFPISIFPIFTIRNKLINFDVIEGPDYLLDAKKISHHNPSIPYVLRMHGPQSLLYDLFYNRFESKEIKSKLKDILNIIKLVLYKKSKFNFENILSSKKISINKWRYFENLEINKATVVAAPSNAILKYTKEKYNSSTPVILSPHPYVPSNELLSIKNKRINKKIITIGYLGRLEEKKGIKTICECIPYLCNKYDLVKFKFVGKINNELKSKKNYRNWILDNYSRYSNKLIFTGQYSNDNIHLYVKDFDIAVIPSWWENFPNTCLELMSAGKAIIASSNGGMIDMIVENESGLLFDPFNYFELQGKIESLIINEELRLKLGFNARKKLLDEYTSVKIGEQLEDLYNKAILLKSFNISE